MNNPRIKQPCIQCGDTFVDQVEGKCFNCITWPLIIAEGHSMFCEVWGKSGLCTCGVRNNPRIS